MTLDSQSQAIPSSELNNEEFDIEQKIEIEIAKSHYNMIRLGGITNIISGIVVIWVLYGLNRPITLFSWYSALVAINLINIAVAAFYSKRITDPAILKHWYKIFAVIFSGICLIWGSIGILFVSNDIQYQIYIIAFLLAVLIGFCFASITDFFLAIISITCLIVPTIVYRSYLGVVAWINQGVDPGHNIGISISLLLLGTFLLITCFIGDKLVKKFFRLTFENIALNLKLENMNKFLEQRVKERTIELEKSLKLVTYQATHDLLTELPNQRLLEKYVKEAIIAANNEKRLFGVIFFTINEIEKINDGLGHSVGDFVIKTIAQRFLQRFPAEENKFDTKYTVTLSRKDIFVILIEPIHKLEEVEEKVEKIFSILEDPVFTEQQVIRLTGSMGVSLYPRNGRDIRSLLMNADAAMLRAKQQGGNNLNMYRSEINADISKQLEMEINLHSAVKNSEFTLHFQPFLDLKTKKICGMEALVRWKSPSLGLISPADFIPLAEANGIIIPLGEWVLRTACNQTKIWHQLGFTDLKVAVNLSAKQMQQKNLIPTIMNILEESNLKPENIELELTESEAFMEDVLPVLQKIQELGFGLSIDDFGTGYSGLSNLKLLEIAKLKIDKSFVSDLEENEESKAIVSNIISLAKKMDIKVLAEGVETKDQLNYLREHECDMIQGYYISPPVSSEVFTELLKNQSKIVV